MPSHGLLGDAKIVKVQRAICKTLPEVPFPCDVPGGIPAFVQQGLRNSCWPLDSPCG